MTHLSPSGAYVRKKRGAPEIQSHSLQKFDVDQKIWELLKTPHTIESLRRSINDHATDRTQIESAMKRLLDADIIELSPDS